MSGWVPIVNATADTGLDALDRLAEAERKMAEKDEAIRDLHKEAEEYQSYWSTVVAEAERKLAAHEEMLRQEMAETNKAHARAEAAEAECARLRDEYKGIGVLLDVADRERATTEAECAKLRAALDGTRKHLALFCGPDDAIANAVLAQADAALAPSPPQAHGDEI